MMPMPQPIYPCFFEWLLKCVYHQDEYTNPEYRCWFDSFSANHVQRLQRNLLQLNLGRSHLASLQSPSKKVPTPCRACPSVPLQHKNFQAANLQNPSHPMLLKQPLIHHQTVTTTSCCP